MKTEIKNRFEACARALIFVSANASRIPGARLPILIDELHTVVEDLGNAAAYQSYGHREFRAAACERLHFANLLREEMRFIALMAKSLDRQLYPGLRYQLRLPRSQSYLALIATATSFIELLTPIKADFLERGFPPDFIERIAALVEEVKRANQAKNSGLLERMHSTATLMLRSSRGLAILSEMHAIITLCFRHNTALLAEWETARHVRRPNKRRPIEATTAAAQENAAASARCLLDETSVPSNPTNSACSDSDMNIHATAPSKPETPPPTHG